MAAVIESNENTSNPQPAAAHSTQQTPPLPSLPRKWGKYLPEEDLIMVRDVAAVRAHVAKYGETRALFEQAANKANQNPHMRQKVTWKAVQDRCKRLQEDFDAEDASKLNLSGVAGGEMGELYQSLSQMREERESFLKDKDSDKSAKQRREEEKERMGRTVVEMALRGKRSRETGGSEDGNGGAGAVSIDGNNGGSGNGSAEDDGCDEVEVVDASNGSARKAPRHRAAANDMGMEFFAFGEQMKEAEILRMGLKREKLRFEREKYEKELVQRDKDREERRKEREDARRFELEKLKMMFDAFRSAGYYRWWQG